MRAFGIAQRYRHFDGVARRSAFLVDELGVIRNAWAYEDAEVPDVDELLEACRALRPSAGPA